MEKNKEWSEKLGWMASIIVSAGVVIGSIWNFGIKATLANEFITQEEFAKAEIEINKQFNKLEQSDDRIGQKIDKVSDKIDNIYKILIQINSGG